MATGHVAEGRGGDHVKAKRWVLEGREGAGGVGGRGDGPMGRQGVSLDWHCEKNT